MESICEYINFDDNPRIPLDTIIPASQVKNSENLDRDSTIIWRVLFHKFLISRVWNDFNVSSWYLRKLIKKFNKNIKLVRRENKRYLNKRQKLSKDHIGASHEEANSLIGTKFTVSDLKWKLIKRLKNEIDISESTLKRKMKNNLKLRLKKWGLLNKIVKTQPGVRQICESIILQLALDKKEFRSVYIDEFKFSSESYTEYGWTKWGTKEYRFINKSNFNMSFMIGFSLHGIEGVVVTNGTFNSQKFKKFIWDTVKGESTNLALIMDNARIHKAYIINRFWRDSGILAVTIQPYSPFWNPCEKLILRIKSAARKIKESGKIITLQTFKEIIDRLQPESFKTWKRESWLEAYYFLKNYAKT